MRGVSIRKLHGHPDKESWILDARGKAGEEQS